MLKHNLNKQQTIKINTMETFNYDEVIELMSECLNNLEDRVEVNDLIEIIDYDLKMGYDNRVEVEHACFSCSGLYDEIGDDFRSRLDELIKYKESSMLFTQSQQTNEIKP